MAGRIRSIKPEILEDDRTAGLDDATFRMFVSGLLLADDYGNLRANPGLLHASIFWAARDPRESLAKVSAGLETLAGLGLWRLYVEHGQKYAHIKGWTRHQKVDHPGKPRVPLPPDDIDSDTYAPFLASMSRESRESLGLPRETLAPDHRPPIADHRSPISPSRGVGGEPGPSAAPQPTPSDSDSTPPATGRTATSAAPGNGKARADRATVEAVMAHWRVILGHPKAVLDRKREAAIRRALVTYGEAGCLEAIDGCARSDWHTGRDPKGDGQRYDDPTLIFRDAAHVEGFRDLARGGAGPAKRPRPVRLCERCGKPIGDRESFVEGCHNACYYAPRVAAEVPA